MQTRRATVLIIGCVGLMPAAGEPSAPAPDTRIREGIAAFAGGDLDAADRHFAEAQERSADPGLVAFNRGAVLFAKGQFREAEVQYLRALGDAAIPADRRAKALFNRGVCMLKRGGDGNLYRTAIACFEQCIDVTERDAELTADARHNLEVAKLLWLRERAKSQKPPPPGDEPRDPAEPPRRTPEPKSEDGTTPNPMTDSHGTSEGKTKFDPSREPVPKGADPRSTPEKTPGVGSLPVLLDTETPQPLSSEDTRALLQKIAERLDRERKANTRMLTGPERTDVRDW